MRNVFAKFRDWQRNPIRYEDVTGEELRQCRNCGRDFVGNYCPCCGQKAGVGRLSWKTVSQGIMNVWGAGDRSMPYSLVQLLGRPGYLIGDYLDGKRQVCYPPFRMLLIVSVFYLIISNLMGEGGWVKDDGGERDFLFVEIIDKWFVQNPGWGMVVFSTFLLLPTWVLFHFSPRHSKHTLPEGFFIQVFMSTINLMALGCWVLGAWCFVLIAVYYLVAYYQLFGYGVWGTIWRTLLCFFEGFFIMLFLAIIYEYSMTHAPLNANRTWGTELRILLAFLFLNILLMVGCYYFGKKSNK